MIFRCSWRGWCRRCYIFAASTAAFSSGPPEAPESLDLWLTVLFGFGSVFYFSAVQGQVWFTAHVVASLFVPAVSAVSFGRCVRGRVVFFVGRCF